jgi:hypothetical protein
LERADLDHDGLRPNEPLTARIGATDGNHACCALGGRFRSACRPRFGFPVAGKQFVEVSDLDRGMMWTLGSLVRN